MHSFNWKSEQLQTYFMENFAQIYLISFEMQSDFVLKAYYIIFQRLVYAKSVTLLQNVSY